MEKLTFTKKKIPSDTKSSLCVRIGKNAYCKALEISYATGLSMTEVVTQMLTFAAQHTEVV